MATVNIFLVDDHMVVREGLKTLITAQADMAVVGEGGKLDNPARFSKMVGDLMARAME